MAIQVMRLMVCFQIRYAYELLTNPLLKRDYEIFGIDEQLVSFSSCIFFIDFIIFALYETVNLI